MTSSINVLYTLRRTRLAVVAFSLDEEEEEDNDFVAIFTASFLSLCRNVTSVNRLRRSEAALRLVVILVAFRRFLEAWMNVE